MDNDAIEKAASYLLPIFKRRMHISHGSEDDNLKELLSSSFVNISGYGIFDVETNLKAQELIIERTRYAYNDAVEYFDGNFASQINVLSMELYTPTPEVITNEEV
ncbi:phage gp6-like head-tail connector protein [Listeria monocytogenes]|nr:phage gp6-like head-tail connector protein [Listeria monocytogenes]